MIFLIGVVICLAVSCSAQYAESKAPIVRQFNVVYPDGSYSQAYETGNEIFAEEQGFIKISREKKETQVVQGQYQYTSPKGQVIKVVYTADESGFQPQGEHLPTPPPTPPLIQRTLEFLVRLQSFNDSSYKINSNVLKK